MPSHASARSVAVKLKSWASHRVELLPELAHGGPDQLGLRSPSAAAAAHHTKMGQ